MLDLLTPLVSGHTAVMGQNFVTLIGGMIVCAIYARFWLRADKGDPAGRMAFGIMLVSGSLAIHRGFWFLWRFFLAIHEPEIAGQFVLWADWLIFAVAGIVTGYMIHIEPYARRLVRRLIGPLEPALYWPCMIVSVAVLYVIGALAGIIA